MNSIAVSCDALLPVPKPLLRHNNAGRVRLLSLGCRLNEAELEGWAQDFDRRGFAIVDDREEADLVVINTCAVTQEAVRKSRQLIRRHHQQSPHARIIISGCLATLEGEAVARENGVDLVVANAQKDQLVTIALEALRLPVMPEMAITDISSPLLVRGRQRAFIKVQDGCRYQCTFCITTQARGKEKSRATQDIIDQIKHIEAQGIQEIALTGVHLGGYGSDNQSSLTALLENILQATEIPRIRLGSLEPWGLDKRFWDVCTDERVMPHLHLPLQSGSNRILRLMARRCKREEFLTLVSQGRSQIPQLNITTDIIVGFPSESNTDWQDTLSVVEEVGFSHIHIFSFSPRAGTRAAKMQDIVSDELKKERVQELAELATKQTKIRLQEIVGTQQRILVEGRSRLSNPERKSGYTPNFLPVRIPDQELPTNTLQHVLITGIDKHQQQLLGTPC